MTTISVPISSNAQWHELRAQNVGCSEVAALFGVHDYLTGYALAARKMGRLAEQGDNAAMKRGRRLEPIAREYLADQQPEWKQIIPSAYYYDPDLRFGATPDLFAATERGVGVVQIKTVMPGVFREKWHNDAGEVEPPLWIAMQAMCEQHLTCGKFAFVAALILDSELTLELIEVPYIPDVVNQARARVASFWKMVDAGELPEPDYGRDAAVIAKLFPQDDGSELDLTGDNELPEIIERFEALKMAKKTAEDGIDDARARIEHRLGSAASARYAGGTILWPTIRRQGYYVKPSSFRQLRIKHEKHARAAE